jgi:hypothetical protein
MTVCTITDPAVPVPGHDLLLGRRAHSRTPLGGGDRNGVDRLVGRRSALSRETARGVRASARPARSVTDGRGR